MAIYDINGNELLGNDTTIINNSVKAAIASNLRDEAYLKQLLSESGGSMQGSCTDGLYIYYIYHNTNILKKYNLATGEVTSHSYESGLYGHANDMTYNPNTDRIYITVMDDNATIAVVNPSTLEQESTFTLYGEGGALQPSHGIAYDRINNRYVFAGASTTGIYGRQYTVTDANFNFVKKIMTPQSETYTIQGIETDGYLIYRALWDKTGNTNYVTAYDYDGNFVKTIHIPNSNELETIMQDWQGNWYCNFNKSSGGSLFICGLHKIPYENIERIV